MGNGSLSIGQGADIYKVSSEIGDRVCLSGGLDPWDVLRKTTKELEYDVKSLIEKLSLKGGHMLNSAGQIAVETPENKIEMIVRTAKKYWK
jgi:uroporphyrinogen-III decarboxylase